MDKYTLTQAIKEAFAEAERKIAQGKFIKTVDTEFDWDDPTNFEDGDPENVNTLTSLYGQFLDNNNDRLQLENALSQKYPEYI